MTVHYFPLQVDPARYSAYLDDSILKRLIDHNVSFVRYHPYATPHDAGRSSFYNVSGESRFRALQLALFFDAVGEGVVHDGDLVFFSDLFMPGAEAVEWMAHLHGLKLRVRGLIHGGSMNEHDLIRGARGILKSEHAIMEIVEEAYVGSTYMRDLFWSDQRKVVKTGFLLDEELPYDMVRISRDPIVVFNGRHSPDKQPEMFARLASEFPEGEVLFIDCMSAGFSKAEYYELLCRARVVVSFALHETFGTAIQEAVALGCVPVVPDRLCYVEQFAPQYRYASWAECIARVQLALDRGMAVPPTVDSSGCIERWFSL